jgi:hypothetical protein
MVRKLDTLSKNVNQEDDNLKGQIVNLVSQLNAFRFKYVGELKILYL